MKINKKYMVIVMIALLLIISFSIKSKVYAENEIKGKIADYTEEYKKWLELPEQTRNKIIAPQRFNINQNVKQTNMPKLFKSNYISKYNLQNIIPDNTIVRNQMQTNTCWAFSTIGVLESTLGLADYKNGNTVKKYNFSERHLEYSTSKIFLNNKINLFGFNRKIDTGGNSNIAFSYFTSGFGPVDETSMPFKNNKDLIELGEIQNKKVTAKIIDTVDFPSIYDNSFTEKEEVKEQIKKHIMNHGGVYASIYGAQPYSEYYNNSTGAIFCDKLYADHAVLIIGWDDTYSVNNFNPNHKPQNSGAWIIKNSWGTDIGNNGIMYLSYEDANVYYSLAGIQNATNKIDYDNIYQYNELGYNIVASVYVSGYCGSKIYLANDFSKKTEGKEYLTEIALYAPENYICSVYVNANGTSKHKDFLTKVKLKDGETESFGTGYHTIEFAEPIEIKGNEFTIVVEIENGMNNEVYYCLETNEDEDADDIYKTATIETGKCYISMDGQYEYGVWRDLSDKSFLGFSSDSTIKAFTICEQNEQGNISKEGDVNGDNKVNSLDAVEILKYVAKKKMLTEKQLLLADTTKDDKVNSLDAVRILKFVAKKISKL